ncbi:MAG: DUF1992 domain-containing protein [Desulfovibrio sp.]|nr:DUF1992 domain-containing protein [Desulfovibrio sp.]
MNGLDAIACIAERKILEAAEDGAFDNLPGMGKPLVFEDLSHLPEDLRMAYTLLKNGGFLEKAPEQGSPVAMSDLLPREHEEGRMYGKMRRLDVMMSRVRRLERLFLPDDFREETDLADSPYIDSLLKRV